MDVTLLANFALLVGALGVNLALDSSGTPSEAAGGSADDGAADHMKFNAAPEPVDPEADLSAHRDILAWFLNGGDDQGSVPVPAEAGGLRPDPQEPAGGVDSPLADPLATHPAESADKTTDSSPAPEAGTDLAGVSEIDDFQPASDRLELHYTPLFGADAQELPPEVTVAVGPDNASALIRLNGETVARVIGTTTLSPDDIMLVREPA